MRGGGSPVVYNKNCDDAFQWKIKRSRQEWTDKMFRGYFTKGLQQI